MDRPLAPPRGAPPGAESPCPGREPVPCQGPLTWRQPGRGESPARRRARQAPARRHQERIREIALELFAEQGYEDLAAGDRGRLGVTRPPCTTTSGPKRDIVRLRRGLPGRAGKVLWGASQRGPRRTGRILARACVGVQLAVIRFMGQNQAAMHSLMSDSGA
jgi:hypothetical protein